MLLGNCESSQYKTTLLLIVTIMVGPYPG